MKIQPLVVAAIILPTTCTFAEPVVVKFESDPGIFALRDYDPTLPSISFVYSIFSPGGGSGSSQIAPALHEGDTPNQWSGQLPFDTYEIEAADARGANPFSDRYWTFAEFVIDDQAGEWVVPIFTFDFNPTILPPIYSSDTDFCTECGIQTSFLNADTIHYLPFRYRDIPKTGGDDTGWYYGWVAMRGETWINDDPACTTDDGCPFQQATFASYQYVAFALETIPDVMVVAGGGFCEADLNFDAQRNFFDVSEFLKRFANDDLRVDFDGNGMLNFFDVSAFLSSFNGDCQS